MDLKTDSHYVLSGGMGALGMVTAQYLLEELMGDVGRAITWAHMDNLWIMYGLYMDNLWIIAMFDHFS